MTAPAPASWVEHPFGLVSLGEIMDSLDPAGLVSIGYLTGNAEATGAAVTGLLRLFAERQIPVRGIDHMVPEDFRAALLSLIPHISDTCVSLGLPMTLSAVRRVESDLRNERYEVVRLGEDARDISRRFIEETRLRLFLQIDPEHAEYYANSFLGWEAVVEAFPSSSYDIEEAARCYAVSRYTACVFHAMRVAESGLAAVATRVGLQNSRPNWEEAIKYLEGQLNKKYDEMETTFRGDVDFLRGVAAHMRDVNIAWRRRVAHMDTKYTKDEARRILGVTRGLMEHLATKLTEVSA